MDTIEECLLKADHYASAARLVGDNDARGLIRLAVIWRNRALRMQLEARERRRMSATAQSEHPAHW